MIVAILFSGINIFTCKQLHGYIFYTSIYITKAFDDAMMNEQTQTLEALLNQDAKLHCICQQSSDKSRLNL